MAVNPNTDFTTGQVLTADQANRWPRGVMAIGENTTASGTVAVETLAVTSGSFTAVANRYYKITYFEPILQYISGTVTTGILRIRLTNLAGAEQVFCEVKISNANNATGIVTTTKTLTAGSTVLVGTFAPAGGGSINCFRSATAKAQIIIEDLGPA